MTNDEKIHMSMDWTKGYCMGTKEAEEENEKLRDENQKLRNEIQYLREKYDSNYLRRGDIVETTEGDLAVLISECTDGSWDMTYASGHGDNLTSRCFRKTGNHLDLSIAAFDAVMDALKEVDTEW